MFNTVREFYCILQSGRMTSHVVFDKKSFVSFPLAFIASPVRNLEPFQSATLVVFV